MNQAPLSETDSTPLAGKSRFDWLHLIVRIALNRSRLRTTSPRVLDDEPGIRQLRVIERWLFDHHVAQNLFDPFGAPRADTVHVFFRSDEPEKALAFRVLCNELGLSGAMDQVRIVVNQSARLRPPLLDLAKGGL